MNRTSVAGFLTRTAWGRSASMTVGTSQPMARANRTDPGVSGALRRSHVSASAADREGRAADAGS